MRKSIALLILVVLATSLVAGIVNADITSGLVCFLPMDEGSGGYLVDYSGFNNHGVIDGATWVTYGKFNDCLSFDGSNDFVSMGTAASLDLSDLTVSAWINVTSVSGIKIVASKSAGGLTDSQWEFRVNDNKIQFCATDGDSVHIAEKTGLLAGYWFHVVGVKSGDDLTVYIAGVAGSTSSLDAAGSTTGNPTVLGRRYGDPYFYNGTIDDFRLYNRALSSSEIIDLYEYDPTAPVPTATPATSLTDTAYNNMVATITLLAVVVFNFIVLMVRKPLFSYVLGIITIGLAGFSLANETLSVIYEPYTQIMVFFVTVVCLIDVSVRRT